LEVSQVQIYLYHLIIVLTIRDAPGFKRKVCAHAVRHGEGCSSFCP